MTCTSETSAYETGLDLPTPVREFLSTLAEVGTVVHVGERGVTVHLPGQATQSLGQRLLLLAQSLGARGLAPAFPTTPGNGWALPSYRWQFDAPTEAGNDQWSLLVPPTADLLHLLGVVSGLGAYPRDYAGAPVLPVTLCPRSIRDLAEIRTEIETELSAWFGETVRLHHPQD